MSPSVMAAGVAADNVICAIYFIALFSFASKIPPEASASSDGKYYLGHKNDVMRFFMLLFAFVCVSVDILLSFSAYNQLSSEKNFLFYSL